jgi:hypothetical protein
MSQRISPKRPNVSIRRRPSSPKRVTYKEVTPFTSVQAPVIKNPLLLEPIQRPPPLSVSNILPPSLMQPKQPERGIMPSFSTQEVPLQVPLQVPPKQNPKASTAQVNFFRQPAFVKLPLEPNKNANQGH